MIEQSIQEELRNRFNPDGSLLRQHQIRMLELLKYLDSICEKHKIKYWLCSGTLIGAARHGGFIPWDDDLDIEMMKEDYKKFVKVMKNEKNDRFALQTHDSDFNYITPYGKLRDLHSEIKEDNTNDLYYKYHGIYIDVFIMEPSSSVLLNKIANIIQYRLLYQPNTVISNRFIRKIYFSTTYFLLHKILFPIVSLMSKINSKDQLRHTPGSCFLRPRNKKDIFPLKKIQFEDAMFPVPNKYDNYLKKIYGEYMVLPNLDNIKLHTTNVNIS